MISSIRSAATLLVKVMPEGGEEKLIGFCTGFNFNVNNGIKIIYTVDSPFPSEVAYGAQGMAVNATMNIVMPKGMTLEKAGLVPYRTAGGASANDSGANGVDQNSVFIGTGKYMHVRLYDRETRELVYGIEFCKVNSYAIDVTAKSVVRGQISLVGKFAVPGNAGGN